MPIALDTSKYPTWFFYLLILYFIVLAWALMLSFPAYVVPEAQLLLLIMLLPALILAVYAFLSPKSQGWRRIFRALISVLSIFAMFISALMGYVFFG